jgi:hypothetical protein
LKEVRKPKETAEILQAKEDGYPLDMEGFWLCDKFRIRAVIRNPSVRGGRVRGQAAMVWARGDNKIRIVIAMVHVIGPEVVQLMTRGGKVISSSFKPNPC